MVSLSARIPPLSLLALAILLYGCDPQPTETPTPSPSLSAPPVAAAELDSVWQHLSEAQHNSVQQVKTLQAAVDAFLAQPGEQGLAAAREQWLLAYQQFAPLRSLPPLAQQQPALLGQPLALSKALDSWPITAGFIDYVGPYRFSGLVNDITVPMTAETLRQQQGVTADGEVSLGFQAMAYLLWGNDGKRPASDFIIPTDSQVPLVDTPPSRRRAYLKIVAQLILDDLETLGSMLQAGNPFRKNFDQLLPGTRHSLWQAALTQQRRALEQEWRLYSSHSDEGLRNPHGAGLPQAWCSSLAFMEQLNRQLALDLPAMETEGCWELSPQAAAERLLSQSGAQTGAAAGKAQAKAEQ